MRRTHVIEPILGSASFAPPGVAVAAEVVKAKSSYVVACLICIIRVGRIIGWKCVSIILDSKPPAKHNPQTQLADAFPFKRYAPVYIYIYTYVYTFLEYIYIYVLYICNPPSRVYPSTYAKPLILKTYRGVIRRTPPAPLARSRARARSTG